MPDRNRLEAEIAALQDAIDVLGTSAEGLRLALRHVARGAREASEPPLMPNYARAEEQLRMALNATAGATRSVQRRLDMRRKLVSAHTRRREAGAK
jgi:hypothetical protein